MRMPWGLKNRVRAIADQGAEEGQSPRSTLAAIVSRNPEHHGRLVQFVRAVNASGGGYHRLDFGDGVVMLGNYDMHRYVHFYHIPERLDGQSVLDVGAADGYFALECARRGGAVTAMDVDDKVALRTLVPLLNVPLRFALMSVYELDEGFGLFDLVVCGSLLMHLPDPLGALRRIRSVCRGQAVIATACPRHSASSARPVCEFVGEKSAHGDYWHYWNISATALSSMLLAADFSQVTHESHFVLASEPGRTPFATPHVAMAATV